VNSAINMNSHSGQALTPHSPRSLSLARPSQQPDIIYFNDLIREARLCERSIVYVDITDYILFFLYRCHVSGIQRVVHSLMKYADFSNLSDKPSVIYCMTAPETGCFAHVSPCLLASLIDAVESQDSSVAINDLAKEILEQSHFKQYLSIDTLDILLIPGGPWASVLQLNLYQLEKQRIGFRCYCVCYDLIPIDYPEFCATGLSNVFRSCYRKLSQIVDGYISISNYSSTSIALHERRLGITRAQSMYDFWRLGDYDGDIVNTTSAQHPPELTSFCKKIKGLEFVLVVSTIEPRKNHHSLLRAWRLLLQKVDISSSPLPALVFAGKIGWNSENLVDQIHSLQDSGVHVYILEGMSDACLDWLYSNCKFSVMPSYVEGWGLSITESMMRGRVCLTSNTSSMIEAASGIAPLFDPYNVRDLCDKLNSLVYGNSLISSQESLVSYRPVSWIESTNHFYTKLANMHALELEDSVRQALIPAQPLAAKTVDKGMNVKRFTPPRNKEYLDGLPCWQPLSPEGLLSPLTARPWIHLLVGSEFLTVKARLTKLANQSDHPIIKVFDESGQLLSTKAAATLLPSGDCIIYACVDQSCLKESSRRIKVVFLDIEDDMLDAESKSYGGISASIASQGWFSIRYIDIV
jgi:glycosyltransferase involved in cell wall biosynthesis